MAQHHSWVGRSRNRSGNCGRRNRSSCNRIGQGAPWPADHPRAKLAGRTICGGYCVVHIQNRGDLDWHCNETRLQHWSCAQPCFKCCCPRDEKFNWDLEYELRGFPEHPLFDAPWVQCRRDHIAIDPAHTLDKGITEHVMGNLFKNLVYEKQLCTGDIGANLRILNILLQLNVIHCKSSICFVIHIHLL